MGLILALMGFSLPGKVIFGAELGIFTAPFRHPGRKKRCVQFTPGNLLTLQFRTGSS
jgi:hypothetical protein